MGYIHSKEREGGWFHDLSRCFRVPQVSRQFSGHAQMQVSIPKMPCTFTIVLISPWACMTPKGSDVMKGNKRRVIMAYISLSSMTETTEI